VSCGWFEEGSSIIGTGIVIKDVVNAGLHIESPHSNAATVLEVDGSWQTGINLISAKFSKAPLRLPVVEKAPLSSQEGDLWLQEHSEGVSLNLFHRGKIYSTVLKPQDKI